MKSLCRWVFFGFSLLLAVNAPAVEPKLHNQLKNNPSPYLAMHGDDPVHWQLWSQATLQKAKSLNRPLFVSSGYFSCHWCHVMQRESYKDPALAKLLNDYFIPVKLDRELNPALDAHLIEFVELTRGQAGWPLNVFLTPDGYPIVGMTYMPRDQFFSLLTQFRQHWTEDEAQLKKAARDAMDEWRRIRQSGHGRAPVEGNVVQRVLAETDRVKDELGGGFGQQNKFPMVSQLQALLFLRRQGKAAEEDSFIRLTLDRMASQGMHDNLGGGFFRYTTDPGWQVPHYEKMLYDNAQLAVLYLDAAAFYKSAHYRAVGLDTVDFMLREMRNDQGAFIGSFSAVDSRGREGYYYLWSDATLDKLLTDEEHKAVQVAWLGPQAAESEYGHLPRWQGSREEIAAQLHWTAGRLDKVLESARKKMLAARAARELLPDGKVLAAWNGLALSALAKAYTASGKTSYAEAAARLADYLSQQLWDGKQLLRSRDGGKALGSATLEDYGLVAQGLWDWSQSEADEHSHAARLLSAKLVRLAWQRYFKKDRWRQIDTPLIPMLDGKVALDDSALPSTTAVISRLSQVQSALAKDATIQKLLATHLGQVRANLSDSLFWYAGYVELLAANQR